MSHHLQLTLGKHVKPRDEETKSREGRRQITYEISPPWHNSNCKENVMSMQDDNNDDRSNFLIQHP